ncbi:MAG: YbdK family carboxylate-amine ligase [Planctomycetota bacterium]
MQTFNFSSNPKPTLGVELELGLIDGDSMKLTSAVKPLLDSMPEGIRDCYKPELMQSVVEINTDVCKSVEDARKDLEIKLRDLEKTTDQMGLRLWWGATHPFSGWREQEITPNPRYEGLVTLLQEMARRLVTFGMHVHVGVDSGDKAVMICDRIMQHLPTLLSLSCSSPYWEARDTGLHSHRSKIMEGLPTAGLPTLMRNWSEYVWLVNHMVETGFINTIREIWWDVRPHHAFGTVEVRVCDMPGSLSDVLAITALIQSLVKALSDEIDRGTYQHDCHPMMVQQNKWRACRYGTEAQLVNSYSHKIQTVPEIAEFMVDRLGDTAKELGCYNYLCNIQEIANRPSWAQQQRDILDKTGKPEEVVRQLTEQSRISPAVGA